MKFLQNLITILKNYDFMRYILPLIFFLLLIFIWERIVLLNNIPEYIFPTPSNIYYAFINNWYELFAALFITLKVTVSAILLSSSTGVLLAIFLSQSRLIENTFFPYAVFIQVTPIVTIAPFIIIWVNDIFYVLLILAWISSVFPIISNTLLGLKSVDRNLIDLFSMYSASRFNKLIYLLLPSTLPYYLGGLRISGGLALIGTVVAEMVAGTGGENSGLASRLLESSYRLELSTALACFFLLSLAGYIIYIFLSFISYLILSKWHESSHSYDS
jgi:NitT/TauT family transport system permease protein